MKRFFKSILTIISLASALLLLVSVWIKFVNPYHAHVLAFLGFAFPALWLGNLILSVLWGIKKRWQALIPLLAVLLTYGNFTQVYQVFGRSVESKNELHAPLSVMSFNVRIFDYYNNTGKKNAHEEILNFIKKENPDVVCLQEFFSYRKKRTFSETYITGRLKQYPYRHIEYSIVSSSGKSFGIATFSKYPIKEKKSLRFGGSANFSIQTDISVQGKRIRVFNNHLESIKFNTRQLNFLDSINHKNEAERKEGLRTISRKLRTAFKARATQAQNISRHIKNSAYPVVVCGDFNDTPVSYVYNTMQGDLLDAFVESGRGLGGTYNGKLPSFRIDFILHDPSFKSYNFQRFNLNLSDHYPIKTLIDLSPEE